MIRHRRGHRVALSLLVAVISLFAVPVGTVTSAAAGPLVGSDISWPQCGQAYPATPAFGIVGVNGGRPYNHNPCLTSEFRWAAAGAGPVQLYINTANPGAAGSGLDWYGQRSPDAGCRPTNEAACAFDYGYGAAGDAYAFATSRVPAGTGHVWWLDVETGNSWSPDQRANLAVIAGSIAFLRARSVLVGIYSTRYQWGIITGGASLPTIPNWVPGAARADQAPAFCAASRSFSGGPVVMTQYTTHFDFDYLCPGAQLQPPAPPPPSLLAGLGDLIGRVLTWLTSL
jgi:hypothetical protein